MTPKERSIPEDSPFPPNDSREETPMTDTSATPRDDSKTLSSGASAPCEQPPDEKASVGRTITALATLPAEALVDASALADMLRVSKRTIRRMVGRYELPPSVRLGGRATWQVGRIREWIETRVEREQRKSEREEARLRKHT